jgi:hypothetical protein
MAEQNQQQDPMMDQFTPPINTESLRLPELETQDMSFIVDNVRTTIPDPTTNMDYAQADMQRQGNLSAIFTPQADKPSFYNEGFEVGDAYTRLNSGEYVAKFDNFLQGTNNEERFAAGQSTSEKWVNGFTKFLGKTGNAVLGGTLGTLYGIGAGIFTADFSAVWDNDFQNKLDDWNQQMDYKLPNYYTEEEKNKGFFGSMGTANFWANDFLGGLSFTAGAVATEALWAAATGGASLTTTAARWGLRSTSLARNLSRTAKPFKDILSTFNGVGRAKALGKTAQGLNTLRYTMTSAGYEAGVEARHYMNEQRDLFYSQFEHINGRKPSSEEISQFESNLQSTTNAVFATNMALVGSSNLAIFGKMFNVANPLKMPKTQLSKYLFGNGLEVAADGSKQAIKRNLAQRIAGTSYSLLKAPVVEGIYEEGLQSVTTTSAGNYMKSTYDLNEGTLSLMESVYEGLSHTYGTKEGWKEVGLGMLIGIFGGGASAMATGQNPFAPVIDAASKQSSKQTKRAEVLNHYSANKLVNGIFRANGVQMSNELADKAQKRGDLFGQESARTMGILSNIIYGERMNYGNEMMAELETEVTNYKVEQLAENLGITVEEATEMKNQVVEDYKAIRNDFVKNKDFAEYVIGRGKIDQDNEINVEQAREMIAYQMTMANRAELMSQDFVKAIMREVGDLNPQATKLKSVLEVEDALRRTTKENRTQFTNLQKEHKRKQRELDRLEKSRLTQENRINTTREDNQSLVKSLNKTTNDIARIQGEMVKLEQKLEQSYSALTLHTISADSQGVILGSDLANLENNIKEFDDYLNSVEQTDKVKSARLTKYLQEYKKAIDGSRRFSQVIQDLMNPETGLKGDSRTFLNSLKEYNNPTQRLVDNLKASQTAFAEGQAQIFQEQAQTETKVEDEADIMNDDTDNVQVLKRNLTQEEKNQIEQEYDVVIEDNIATGSYEVTPKPGTRRGEKYKKALDEITRKTSKVIVKNNTESKQQKTIDDYISDIISGNEYVLQNFGTNVESRKPNAQEITRYEELLNKMNVDPDTFIGSSISTISKRGLNKIGLTKEELQEFVELNQKLSDWRVIDATTSNNVSLADLIEQKEALNTPVNERDMETMDTAQEIEVAVGAKNNLRTMEMSSEMINTPDTVMVQARGERFHLTHVKPRTIINKGATLRKNGNLVSDLDDLPKGVYTFDFADEVVTFKVVGHSRMEFTETELKKLLDNTDMVVVDTSNIKGSSWSPVYVRKEDGTYEPMSTDYDITTKGSQYNILDPQKLYELSENDQLFFKVSLNDSFNVKFEERYIDAVLAVQENPSKENQDRLRDLEKEIYQRTNIYIVNENNDVIGQLKAASPDVQQTEDFKAIRKYASNLIMENYHPDNARFSFTAQAPGQVGEFTDATSLTEHTLPFTTKVTSLFIGMPNLNLSIGENGYAVPNKVDFNDNTIKMVEAFGVVENGELQLNPNTRIGLKNVNKQFIKGIESTTPIVIVNYKNQKIAYPITIKESNAMLLNKISNIANKRTSASQKAVDLAKLLAENGIDPKQYDIKHIDVDNSFFNSDNFDRLLRDVENATEPMSKNNFLNSSFNIEDLKGAAQITVNLENNPFQSPKIQVDLKTPIRFEKLTEKEEEAHFDNTGKVSNTRLDMITNELLSKKYSEISSFNQKVVSSYRNEIELRLGRKLQLSSDKKSQSDEQINKKC